MLSMGTPTLRQLEYLVAIADHGSFHAAARACGVTQPGLSAQIQQLESQLDAKLLERGGRKVLPTPAGEAVLRHARAVLADVDRLVEASHAHAQPLAGRLRLGVIPTVSPYFLPKALARVRRRYPSLQVWLREAKTDELVALLHRGELDVLLLALEARLDGLETLPLFRDAFVAALPAGHRLARRRRLRESDLADEPVLLLEDGHCLRDQALSFCAEAGTVERTDFRASSLPTLVQMVAGGAGATLLPEMAVRVEARSPGIAIVPFRGAAPARTIGLAWRAASPRAPEFRMLGEALGTPA